jgi:hypothetical protein
MAYSYNGRDPLNKGKEYYDLFIKSGMSDNDANLLARLRVQMDIEDVESRYRATYNIFEKTRDRIESSFMKLFD